MFKIPNSTGAIHATYSDQSALISIAAVIQNAPRAMILTDANAALLAWNRPAQEALIGLEQIPVLDRYRPYILEAANSDHPITVPRSPLGEMLGWRVSQDLVMLQEAQNSDLVARLAQLEAQQERLEAEAEQLRRLAQNDHLTGLLNAASFADQCSAKVAARRKGVLLYLDLDDFKPVNDLHGHNAGDHVLCEVAKRLRGVLREGDLVARLGGDEFGIWLSHTNSADALDRLIHRLQSEIKRPIAWHSDGQRAELLQVRCSMGVAVFDGKVTEFTGLLSLADAAMYADKRARGAKTGRSVAPQSRAASQVEKTGPAEVPPL